MSEPTVAGLLLSLRTTTYADEHVRFDALLHPGRPDAPSTAA